MNDIETPATPPKHPSNSMAARWWPALLCGLLASAAAIAYTYQTREEILAAFTNERSDQTKERGKLSTRVDALQSNLETMSGQPRADVDAISTQFADVTSKLAALNDRLTALEKKPEPAPLAAPVPAPSTAAAPTATSSTAADSAALTFAATSGKPFTAELAAWQKLHPNATADSVAPLLATAQSGIPSEAEMNRRLRSDLDEAVHSKKLNDESIVGKINTHLAGLVSIRKAADSGPYAKLRTDVMRDDLATLTASVEALNDEDRKPLEDWLAAAHARRDTLAALAKLDAGGAE